MTPGSRFFGIAALCLGTLLQAPHSAQAALPLPLRGASPTTTSLSSQLPSPTPSPNSSAAPAMPAYVALSFRLSADVIRRVIWMHINQIRYCYQQSLMRQPTLAGRLVMNFQIDPQGHVQALSVRETTLQSPPLLTCISQQMSGWEFPPTPSYDGLTEINYPFVLRPKVPETPPGIQISDDELARLGIYRDPEPPAVDILF